MKMKAWITALLVIKAWIAALVVIISNLILVGYLSIAGMSIRASLILGLIYLALNGRILLHRYSANGRKQAPPRIAESLLHFVARKEDIEFILGDLAEEYFEILIRSGSREARLWYYRQVLTSLLPLLRYFTRNAMWEIIGRVRHLAGFRGTSNVE